MRKRWLFILLILLPALACGPLSGEETPEAAETEPPAETPAGPGPSPSEGGRCGDGVCDGPENEQICPEDCAEGVAPTREATPLSATGVPDYEPPINVFLVLHIDPVMDRETDTFKVTPAIYQQTHDEIDWLMEEAARHGLHFTALYNGWYPKEALALGDTAQFQELLAVGHEIGSHAHRLTYDPAQDTWIAHVNELNRYGHPNYDAELAHQSWNNAHLYVDAMLTEIGATEQNQAMCAVPFKCSDEGQLMDQFGFTVASGNRSEKGPAYFGHIVWNPWRAAASDKPGHEIEEDLNATYISLDHLAQIGKVGAHGMDLTVPQLQRRFLMLYAEWLSRERSGAEDRVWTFGFVYHPEDGDVFNAELAEFLSWLDEHFIGQASPHGNVIARYATTGDIAREFETWEAEHPGTSSFSYVIDDPYPYTYAILPTMLEGAAYEANVGLGEGVTCFRLSRDGRPIYLLWSDAGERTVDLSAELGGQVRVTSAAGEQSTQDASVLVLTEEPLFVEPLE